ncbi:MAG: GLPGLI family protein [Bacteroidaceae bacterium]|nr:GLPGLI family protein [Bacteroidaceae bacterium]
MKKIFIACIVAFAVCGDMSAQPKDGGRCPSPIYDRGFSKMDVLDTTQMRVRYAFCAEKIDDPLTYIDLQRLDVGRHIRKYYSEFVYLNDSLRMIWADANPNAGSAPNWLSVKSRNYDQWSEYEWSDYFFEDGQLTEYCQMPTWLHRYNSKYTEPIPKQKWTLTNETQTIIGYECQKATCRFRGRDFEAWFTTDIPVECGPWKFGGLPGLILKVYDKGRLYTFEAIGIETQKYPVTRFRSFKDYTNYSREKVWKLQRSFHENWFKAVDYRKGTIDASGNFVVGEAVSVHTPYEPLELE